VSNVKVGSDAGSRLDENDRATRLSRVREGWRRRRRDVGVALIVGVIVVVGGYAEVAFAGRTFDTSSNTAGVNACPPQFHNCPITGQAHDDPRFDLLPQPWQLNPWAHVTSAELHAGRAPLWNPYEAAGAPLAANMASAAFDPLLLPVNLHPTILWWDITFLLVLGFNGIATFVLARVVGLRRWAALAAGVIYGLSGFFFRSSNNSFFRVHLYLPLVLLAVEWVLRRRGLLPIVGLGAAVAGCVLVGMPEPTLIILTVSAIYALVRLSTGPRVESRGATLGRLAIGGGIGLLLAAPLLGPFAEYLGQAKTFKQGAGSLHDPGVNVLNWAAPKIQGNGWVGTRDWVGGAAVVAAIAGVASPARMRRHCGWAFLVAGAVLALKIYGAPVVSVLGHLPGGSQTLWNSWGTPEVALPLALLAGIGIESVFTGDLNRRLFFGWLAAGLLVVGYFVVADRQHLQLGSGAFIGGWAFAALAGGVVIVAAALWRHPRWSGVLVVAVILAELLLLAPRGFYAPRANPYPRQGWITRLTALAPSPGTARIFSTDGLLFPNTAGVYGLADLRVVDAVYVERYFRYFQTFVSPGTVDRWMATGPTEGVPSIFDNPMFDLMGARYFAQKHPFPAVDPSYRVVARADGVLIYENTAADPRAFVVHQVHVAADENATVAYLKRGSTRARDGSVRPAMNPRRQAVAEASSLPRGTNDPRCTQAAGDVARIVHYDSSRVTIDVHTACPGLVVLSDTYFPGWNATVNGHGASVLPTDLAFRGIPVPAGHSTIELRYQPSTFRDGLVAALVAIVGLVLAAALLARSRRRGGAHASRGQPTVPTT
jgi:Bacterial membrane protein YfhO